MAPRIPLPRDRLRRRRTGPAPVAAPARAAHERPPGHRPRAGQRARAAAVPAQRAAPLVHAHGGDHARRDDRLVGRPADLRPPLRHAARRVAARRRARGRRPRHRRPGVRCTASPSRSRACSRRASASRPSIPRRASSPPGCRASGARPPCRCSRSAAISASPPGPLLAGLIASQFGLGGVWLLAIPGLAIAGVQLAGLAALGGATAHARVRRRAPGATAGGRPGLLLVALAVRGYVHFGLLTFIPLLEHDARHNSRAYGSRVLALMLFAGALGTLAIGPLADRYGRRPRAHVLVLAGLPGRRACTWPTPACSASRARARGRRDLDVRDHDRRLAGVPAEPALDRGRPLHRPLDRPRRRGLVRDRPPGRLDRPGRRALDDPAAALLGTALCALLPAPDPPSPRPRKAWRRFATAMTPSRRSPETASICSSWAAASSAARSPGSGPGPG